MLNLENRLSWYSNTINRLKKYAKTRMGHPYTGPVYGEFIENEWASYHDASHKLIDNSLLGIVPGSIADTYINNVGSPYSSALIIQRDVKEIELDLLSILAKYFGSTPEAIRGYVTSGASEASLSCLWWLRKLLQNNNLEEKVYLFTSDQSHASIFKLANILGLVTITIPSINTGKICIDSLEKNIKVLLIAKSNCKLIVSLNVGTTQLGAVDDIPLIADKLKEMKATYNFDYRIHTDAAILGLTIPIVKNFGDNSIFEYTDTMIFSGHKLPATLSISGVALANRDVWDLAFKNNDVSIEYIAGIEDVTALGSRSGFSVIELHHALCSLDIHKTEATRFKQVIATCFENAEYLARNLQYIVGKSNVNYQKNQFTVVFPSPGINNNINFLRKYGLMKVSNDRLGVCILAHVNKSLIDQFINESTIWIRLL